MSGRGPEVELARRALERGERMRASAHPGLAIPAFLEAGAAFRGAGLHREAADAYVRAERPDLAGECLVQDGDRLAAARLLARGGEGRRAAALFEEIKHFADAASCYESIPEWSEAARLWARLGRHRRAGQALLQAGRAEEALETLALAGGDGGDPLDLAEDALVALEAGARLTVAGERAVAAIHQLLPSRTTAPLMARLARIYRRDRLDEAADALWTRVAAVPGFSAEAGRGSGERAREWASGRGAPSAPGLDLDALSLPDPESVAARAREAVGAAPSRPPAAESDPAARARSPWTDPGSPPPRRVPPAAAPSDPFVLPAARPSQPTLERGGPPAPAAPPPLPAATGAASPGRTIAGRYRLESVLGAGAMGQVWAATHLSLERRVALKVLLPGSTGADERETLFLREARSASRLYHPNVVQILDFGRDDAFGLYLVMEYLPGRPLNDLARREAPLAPHRAVDLVVQVLAALEAAHRERILHRDVKPGNVMVLDTPGRPDFVKVVDFGIARAMGSADPDSLHATREGLVRGTPVYMAPEQAQGHTLDARADVYAAGVMLWELLTGRLPYTGPDVLTLLYAKVHRDPDPPSQLADGRPLPGPVAAALMRALARKPGSRWTDAAAFREALRPYAAPEAWRGAPGRAEPAASPEPGREAPTWTRGAPPPAAPDPSPDGWGDGTSAFFGGDDEG